MRLYTSINKRLIFAAIYHFLIIIFGGKNYEKQKNVDRRRDKFLQKILFRQYQL